MSIKVKQDQIKRARRPFFTDEHEMFRKSLVSFLQKEAVPYFETWEEERLIPRSFWEKMGEQGFICPWVSVEYGGMGTDFGFAIILSEELAKIGAGLTGIGTHSNIIVPYLHTFGNEEQKHRFLKKCVKGELITSIAMTEPGAGSDLASIQTTAIRKGNQYILNGQKTFITNGIHSDLIIVACKTDPKAEPRHKGISLILVERDTPGFTRGRKLNKVGMHSQDTSGLIFEDCIVPVSNRLGEEGKGFRYMMMNLQEERLLCATNAVVAAEDMLQLTIQYVKERDAFGKPISQFQNTQFTLAEIATEIKFGRTFVDDLIKKHIDGKEIVKEVSMAKWWTTEMAKRVSTQCMQLHGGYGYMEEYKIARRYRDIPVTSIFAGSNEIMKVIISKQLGLT
nr:acyl-CoA dehydrogenase family protein [Bacillus sp. D386]